jgi:hypothetical protein
LLRTGLWESDRTRPDDLARERPRTTEAMTVDKLEAMAEQGGYQLPWQDLNELARALIAGIKAGDFITMIGRESIAETHRSRGEDFAAGRLPVHEKGLL